MYCDRCGTQLNAGAQFCTKCGKAILAGGTAAPKAGQATGQPPGSTGASSVAAGARSDGRVQRHVRTLAILWAINGVLRLMGVAWMTIFGTMFFPFMRGWGRGMGWPWGRWGMDVPFLGGLFSLGVFLGLFGVLHLVLAWGLFERQPWARTLGLVIGFLALLRFPLGTALGIYTLWVLLPQESGSEYDRLAQGDGRMTSAAVSS